MADEQFYSDLLIYNTHLNHLLRDSDAFTSVPESWHIVVTDVKESTAIFERGNQQQVHIAATGSIIACLNIARERNIQIPFFFGGDGSTLLIPESLLNDCLHALQLHQERCQINFEFYLRVGFKNVGEMMKLGHYVTIAKYKRNDIHVMPIILGAALKEAEKLIKQEIAAPPLDYKAAYNLNLNGMECKWDAINPPKIEDEVLSLIVNSKSIVEQNEVFAKVLDHIDTIYGEDTVRNPVTTMKLKVTRKYIQLRDEVRAKSKNLSFFKILNSVWRAILAFFFTKMTQAGKQYLQDMTALTEVLLIDGSINTVIAGTSKQREQLLLKLDDMESKGIIKYGYHISAKSVISCFVVDTDAYHIHFLDGENGGYTRASKILKLK